MRPGLHCAALNWCYAFSARCRRAPIGSIEKRYPIFFFVLLHAARNFDICINVCYTNRHLRFEKVIMSAMSSSPDRFHRRLSSYHFNAHFMVLYHPPLYWQASVVCYTSTAWGAL
jgi:hypothetical protein